MEGGVAEGAEAARMVDLAMAGRDVAMAVAMETAGMKAAGAAVARAQQTAAAMCSRR